jgi:regulator of protease activity HflC (stomatin/prohibitin superfamily)
VGKQAVCQQALGAVRTFTVESMMRRKFNTVLNVCDQASVHAVQRFGRFVGLKQPGLYFAIPFVDTIDIVRTSEVCLDVEPLRATTEDNVQVEISGAAYVQVRDPVLALYGHVNPYNAVHTHVQV